MRISPEPEYEEAAAIMAALETLREKPDGREPGPNRWELSGRLGRMLPPGRKLERSPWTYAGWEGKS
jgi:hypothetical protein